MQGLHRKKRRELHDFLYLMDSTCIPLSGRGFDAWAQEKRTTHCAGLKLHMMVTSDTQSPVTAIVTDPNVNDINVGRTMPIAKGYTYVFDKGYCDYNWWYQLHQQGAYYVTRFKANVELFFKWVKQNLKIKRFVGQSKNAVIIQLFCALIAYLLVQLHHMKNATDVTLKYCLAEIKTGLFLRTDTQHHQLER